jgi:hypothetical protein
LHFFEKRAKKLKKNTFFHRNNRKRGKESKEGKGKRGEKKV